jgi:uroporphyrinogen decarboxylase
MTALTVRENFFRAARRQNPEWVPFDFGMSRGALKMFHAHVGDGVDPVSYFDFAGRWVGPSATTLPTPDWRALYFADGSLPESATFDKEWGTASVYDAEADNAHDYFPLRNIETAEEVDAFLWPDVNADYRYVALQESVRQIIASDHVAHVVGSHYFEPVWNLRGFEQLMLDMAEESPVALRLFGRMHELMICRAEHAARCGADVMMTGSDVATQRGPLLSPAMWRNYLFPMMRDCIRAAKAIKPDLLVLYHSCGDVSTMIEGFLEAGIDILDPCQPEAMDIFALKRRYGDVLTFHGGIGVQSVLPFGTPQEVRDSVHRTIDIMGEGGGYICSSSHNIRPETPWENFLALIEAIKEYGKVPARA